MNNPCGKYTGGIKHPLGKKTNGKLTGIFGKKGSVRKYITGGK